MDNGVRIDKWLWAARFYKTRSMAASAVNGGKVRLNGQRIKPSRQLSVGDELRLTKGLYEYTIIVEGLSSRRGPAKFAQTLYTETDESIAKRRELSEVNRQIRKDLEVPKHRPDKHQRRELIRLRKKNPA